MNNYKIDHFNPCTKALDFYNSYSTPEEAWENCPRGDWMLWIAKKLDVDKCTLTLAKGYCAKTVIHLMKDKRSKDAVKAAIKYGKGLIEDPELNAAVDAAVDAIYAAHTAADVAIYAAHTAACAADDADDAYAPCTAIYAANAAAYAAYAANARKKNRLKTANICRKYITKAVFDKIK